MSAGRICSRVIATAAPKETIRVAAGRMAEYDVGTVIVMDDKQPDRAVGLVTDRDIAVRCVAKGLDAEKTPVSALMASPAHAIDEGTPIEEAIQRMANTGTRRLIVTGPHGRAAGILSLDDVLDVLVAEAGAIGRLLHKQQPHVLA